MTQKDMHLVLVDGSGFIFRAYHALPPMTRPDGTPVNAVFGFTNMLARLLRRHTRSHLAIVFDAARRTFRNDIYPLYKAHRPPAPEDLVPQFALIREATAMFGVPALEMEGWEADDLIATYTRSVIELGGKCTIVSSDKDLMQLLQPGVEMLDPIRQKTIGPAEVMEKFGVPPEKMVFVQALMGDAVDNVPGIPGVGPKTAASLVQEFGDLEGVLAATAHMKPSKRRDKLIAHAEDARISLRLVRLCDDIPLPRPVESLVPAPPDRAQLVSWLKGMGFSSVISRLDWHDAPPAPPADTPGAGGAATPEPDSMTLGRPYGPYETVTDTERLQHWAARAQEVGLCALDTETTGLEPLRAGLVGISMATAPGEACYIPLRHELALDQAHIKQLCPQEVIRILDPVLRDHSVLKIFQNAKFDLLVLQTAGFAPVAPVDDTMLISYVLSAGQHGQGMDELCERHLGHTPVTYDEVTGTGRKRLRFDQVALEPATRYAAEDADITLRLWQVLRPQLRTEKALALYEQVERPLVPVLADMERCGIMVDAHELRLISAEFAQRMEQMERHIHTLAGRSFNLASPKQLGEILFDEMGIEGGKRLKSGIWGTDSSVLQELADQGHELPEKILAWRQLAKLKSTYADALLEGMDPQGQRIHTSFQMAVTSTGRLSSNNPNLQNIPIRTEEGGRIRNAFIAPPGYVLLSADYSQIELRLLAHVAQIPALSDAFAKGQDIHARTASEVFGVPLENMDPMVRRRAKAINFGIIYGISAFGLGRQLGLPPGEAKHYIDTYFARYPEIQLYMEKTKEEAKERGYVTTPFGRKCWVPGIKDKNSARRSYAERQAINAPLQGGAADIIKKAMVAVARSEALARLGVRMLLQVHDELLFEVHGDVAHIAAEEIRSIMTSVVTLSVPLEVETGTGKNWSEAH